MSAGLPAKPNWSDLGTSSIPSTNDLKPINPDFVGSTPLSKTSHSSASTSLSHRTLAPPTPKIEIIKDQVFKQDDTLNTARSDRTAGSVEDGQVKDGSRQGDDVSSSRSHRQTPSRLKNDDYRQSEREHRLHEDGHAAAHRFTRHDTGSLYRRRSISPGRYGDRGYREEWRQREDHYRPAYGNEEDERDRHRDRDRRREYPAQSERGPRREYSPEQKHHRSSKRDSSREERHHRKESRRDSSRGEKTPRHSRESNHGDDDYLSRSKHKEKDTRPRTPISDTSESEEDHKRNYHKGSRSSTKSKRDPQDRGEFKRGRKRSIDTGSPRARHNEVDKGVSSIDYHRKSVKDGGLPYEVDTVDRHTWSDPPHRNLKDAPTSRLTSPNRRFPDAASDRSRPDGRHNISPRFRNRHEDDRQHLSLDRMPSRESVPDGNPSKQAYAERGHDVDDRSQTGNGRPDGRLHPATSFPDRASESRRRENENDVGDDRPSKRMRPTMVRSDAAFHNQYRAQSPQLEEAIQKLAWPVMNSKEVTPAKPVSPNGNYSVWSDDYDARSPMIIPEAALRSSNVTIGEEQAKESRSPSILPPVYSCPPSPPSCSPLSPIPLPPSASTIPPLPTSPVPPQSTLTTPQDPLSLSESIIPSPNDAPIQRAVTPNPNIEYDVGLDTPQDTPLPILKVPPPQAKPHSVVLDPAQENLSYGRSFKGIARLKDFLMPKDKKEATLGKGTFG